MLLIVSVPPDNLRGPQYMEQVLDGLFTGHVFAGSVELRIERRRGEVMLACCASRSLLTRLQQQLQAAYPDCHLEWITDDTDSPTRFRRCWLFLQPQHSQLRSWHDFLDQNQRLLADPLSGVLATIAESAIAARMRIQFKPCPAWRKRLLERGCDQEQRRNHRLFLVRLAVEVSTGDASRSLFRQKRDDLIAALGRFQGEGTFRSSWFPRSMVLSTPELATLWHPATVQVRAPTLATVESRQLPAPVRIPLKREEQGLAVLGKTTHNNRSELFGIRSADRLRHLAIVGKTGMGKSTLLLNLVSSDIAAGKGVCLIDPHGDLSEAVAATVPRSRTNDVILFDAGDQVAPLAYNPLECLQESQRPLVASGVLSTFKKLYGESWGPRLEYILRNALLALVEQSGTSLASLLQLLNDGAYRRQMVNRTSDPVVRAFWEQEFAKWKPQFQAEAVAPIQNKVGQFLSHPILRGILGQPQNKLNLRTIMDREQILIINLSKGRIGDDASTMLGSFLVTGLQLAAMSRAELDPSDRTPFYAYVDEFQNFMTESFATILSESRKYGLSLTIANQYLDQIEERTRHAVWGNVGSLLTFQLGARDAEILASELGNHLTVQDLVNLPQYRAYVRLLVNGMPSRTFSMETLSPQQSGDYRRLEIIRRTSRQRYGHCRQNSVAVEEGG